MHKGEKNYLVFNATEHDTYTVTVWNPFLY